MTLSHPVVPRQQFHCKRLQSDLKNLPKVKILKFHFLNWNIIIFDVLIVK